MAPLDTEMSMQHFRMLAEHLSWTSIDDVAVIDDVHAVREAERCPDVLLDDHDRLTGLGKPAAGGEQLSHDDGREPLEGFIQQQNFGFAQERTCDRQHLLLAAGQVCAATMLAIPQAWERLPDALHRPARFRRKS